MADELSAAQKEVYIKKGGTECPYCGNNHLVGSSYDNESGVVTQNITCFACEKSWCDVYRLDNMIEPR